MSKNVGAKIESGIIVNKGVFQPSVALPDGWIDVTGVRCDIGDPVVTGGPMPRPSKHHVLSNDMQWVVLPQKQAELDAIETARKNRLEINQAKAAGGFNNKTLSQWYKKIDDLFLDVSDSAMKTAVITAIKEVLPFIL